MKCRFVDAEKASFPIRRLCRTIELSRQTYYAWRSRGKSARRLADEQLLGLIRAAFEASRQTYGSPRVHAALVADGVVVGVNRVARLMREDGLVVRPRRAFRCTTTRCDPAHAVAPNLLERQFDVDGQNRVWVTDVTFVPTSEGWLYVATVLDLGNREVVGWAAGDTNDQRLTAKALRLALSDHAPPAGLLHHSDRGSTYTAGDYRDLLAAHGIECSMSRKGDCWDNAVAESFFSTLKKELVHRDRYATRREAKSAVFEYIEVFYNRIRLHSTLGYKSPRQYRLDNTSPAL